MNAPIELRPADTERILDLERASFIPPLQAERESLERRFEAGHTMLGMERDGRLSALLSFFHGDFDPSAPHGFPSTLTELCASPATENANALFLYNLEVHPSDRGRPEAATLVRAALDRALDLGLRYAVANCRVPSYAGADARYRQEQVACDPQFRRLVDAHLRGERALDHQDFLRDSTLALYYRLTGCQFLWVLPDFAPMDRASGGIRVIAYGELETRTWQPTVSERRASA